MSNLFVPFHQHSDLSLLDSCTKFQDYVDAAVDEGLKAISISEHGYQKNWVDKLLYCQEKGIRYLHSVEVYLTENLEEKVRDNFHTILIARNQAGVEELNMLIDLSSQEDHFYYKNRLSFDEFLNVSSNIISTSACLASPLNRLQKDHKYFSPLAAKYDFFEVQPHTDPEQIKYNKYLYDLSKEYGKPLIAATDAHAINQYKAECRKILLEAKHINYDETGFDLTYKTYDQFVEAFEKQGSLPKDVYLEAIANTNLLNEWCDELYLDVETIKYPILYGSAENDSEIFKKRTWKMFDEKIDKGIIPPEQEKEFREKIVEELTVFEEIGMNGFMLFMSEIICWCKENGMAIGTARGSVGGSAVAYITDIIDLNPVQWHTVFSRFANSDRKTDASDIDVDVCREDAPKIFKHIIDRFGEDYTARVSAFGKLQDRATIDEIGRALSQRWRSLNKITSSLDEDFELPLIPDNDGSNPWSLKNIDKIKKEFEDDKETAREKYPELFYYYDGLIGTRISQSVHPAGLVVASISLKSNYGTFMKDGESVLMLDMDSAHSVNLVKFDFLLLSNIAIIRDTCRALGKPYPLTYQIDFDDQNVWKDMIRSPHAIFQMNSPFAFDCLKKMSPKNMFEMSLVAAAIRPSGASYRNELLARKVHKNASEQIDILLKDSYGRLVYQEDIIKFLQEVCGLSGSDADTVRRGIAKKKMDVLEKKLPQILDGYCAKSEKPREVAEEEAKEFLQVIEDASAYMFGSTVVDGPFSVNYITHRCRSYMRLTGKPKRKRMAIPC